MKKRIDVSAPGKLMLFGEHSVMYGHPCIVTAVNQRIRVSLESTRKELLEIEAPDVGIVGYKKKLEFLGKKEPKEVRFLEGAVKNFFKEFKVRSGVKINTKSEFSSEFGFGSSSAVTVAVLKGLSILFKKKLSQKTLFDLSYKTVLDIQGTGSGFDLAAAIWGGTLLFVRGGKTITPLKVKRLPLVVGYTGIKADTPTLVRQVAGLYKDYPNLIKRTFEAIAFITREAKVTLIKGDLKKIGDLMNLNQGLLDVLGVNTLELSRLIWAARKGGAYGAKLSGAGGGDCMLALASEKNRSKVEKAIEDAGGKVLKVQAQTEGVKVKKI